MLLTILTYLIEEYGLSVCRPLCLPKPGFWIPDRGLICLPSLTDSLAILSASSSLDGSTSVIFPYATSDATSFPGSTLAGPSTDLRQVRITFNEKDL